MKVKWDVDETTVIELDVRPFTKGSVKLNGVFVIQAPSLQRKSEIRFGLSDGRNVVINVVPQFGGAARIELRVDNQLMVATPKTPITCAACGAAARPNDRFCTSCGKEMPPAESYEHKKRLREATIAIWVLAAIFCVFGVVMFFIVQDQATEATARIDALNSSMVQLADGTTQSADDLRAQLAQAPWTVLLVNLFLSAVMAGLAFWSRWAPLAAILVAAATYAVVQVVNAIIDPATLAQGVVMKVVVVLLLARGIQGALALRSAAHA